MTIVGIVRGVFDEVRIDADGVLVNTLRHRQPPSLVLCYNLGLGIAGKGGQVPITASGPKGAAHFWYPTPFSTRKAEAAN